MDRCNKRNVKKKLNLVVHFIVLMTQSRVPDTAENDMMIFRAWLLDISISDAVAVWKSATPKLTGIADAYRWSEMVSYSRGGEMVSYSRDPATNHGHEAVFIPWELRKMPEEGWENSTKVIGLLALLVTASRQ